MDKKEEARKYFDEGIQHLNNGENDKAIKSFDKAFEFEPKNARYYDNRGIAYGRKGEFDKAIEDFTKAIEFEPKNARYYDNRGIAYDRKEEYDKAIEDHTKAIEFEPKNARYYNNRSFSYGRKEEYDKAIEDYTKAIEFEPKNARYYDNRGIAYFFNKEYVKAVEDNTKSINFGPENDRYYRKMDIPFFIFNLIEEKNLENIFKILKSINKIWENDPVYTNITKDKKDDENTKRLWFYQYLLLYMLSLKNEEIDIVSYTSIDTLKILLSTNKKPEEEVNKFRLTSITEANDIEEGNILLKLLDDKIIFNKEEINKENKLVALQASFSRKIDSLTMFRLYGKKEEKEATGICLVFNNSFFNTSNESTMPIQFESEASISSKGILSHNKISVKENPKLPLYYVLYYDKDTNELIYNPTDSKHDNIIISLLDNDGKEWKQLTDKNDKEVIQNNIQYIFSKIFTSVNKIKGKNEKEHSTLIYMLLINLHYLIKDVAFIEESELRLLQIVPDDENLKDDFNINDSYKEYVPTIKAYKEYLPIINKNDCHIKKIILGNKVENAIWLKKSLEKLLKDEEKYKEGAKIKVSISKLPLR